MDVDGRGAGLSMRQAVRRSKAACDGGVVPAGLLSLLLLSACGGRVDTDLAQTPPPTAAQVLAPAPAPVSDVYAAPDTPDIPVLATNRSVAQPPTGVEAVRGVLLSGVPGQSAYAALGSLLEPARAPSAATGQPPALRLKAVIRRTSTVGQINAALTAAGARIVSMQPGNSEIVLEVAAVPGRAAAEQAAQRLFATQAFDSIAPPDGPPLASSVALAGRAAVEPAGDPLLPETVDDHQSPP